MSHKETQYFVVEWAKEDLLRGDRRERFETSCTFDITEAGVLILDDGVTRTHWNPNTWVSVHEVLET